ncbi:homoserine dehydrogenase [Desulfurivibrio sp. D14AmB]|uniref:homoserine dehydrogenase n=1 Tax=Desulfurivibrio sp. D14AmB TaxID=3374370 RepID=UPI00376F134F
MREIRVGLIGFGTVGSGTAEVLRVQAQRLQRKTGANIRLVRVADIAIDRLPPEFAGVELTRDADQVVTAADIDIVVELIGGIEPAKSFILKAIASNKHVVTANKALISQHGREIFAAAAAKNVEVGFEASVGGGIPVIKALKEGLVANRIESIIGIMNGTANYILNRMTDEGLDFASVLQDAQAHGYAEADPTYDIEGIDTAHKLVILMGMAYGAHVRLDQVTTEGISRIEPIDIEFAREFGYRIKLLAISRNHGDSYEARVHPTMVPSRELLANIGGAFNAIQFTGDMVDDVLLYGQGAGKMPTGSAVAADIVDIARNILNGAINRVPSLGFLPDTFKEIEITPLERLRCPYYFRVTVQDRPGVLSAITGILGKHGISIRSMLQQGREEGGVVPVMMRAYEAEESAVRAALAEIDALEICTAPTVKIRIMDED